MSIQYKYLPDEGEKFSCDNLQSLYEHLVKVVGTEEANTLMNLVVTQFILGLENDKTGMVAVISGLGTLVAELVENTTPADKPIIH